MSKHRPSLDANNQRREDMRATTPNWKTCKDFSRERSSPEAFKVSREVYPMTWRLGNLAHPSTLGDSLRLEVVSGQAITRTNNLSRLMVKRTKLLS